MEERIALSHVGTLAQITPHLQVSGTARGTAVVTSPPKGSVGGATTANLTGNAQLPQVGGVKLTGHLSSNPSLPPQFSGIQGTVTITANSRKAHGSVTLAVKGPAANLASSTTPITFTVQSATGSFSSYIGQKGTGLLAIHTRARPHSNTSTGPFTLSLSIKIS